MKSLFSVNFVVGFAFIIGAMLYVKGYGPTTEIEIKKPVVGKFVSVTPKQPVTYTRPKGLMEIAYDLGVGHAEKAGAEDHAALSELERMQARRDPDPRRRVSPIW